jgi:hypothetical protein
VKKSKTLNMAAIALAMGALSSPLASEFLNLPLGEPKSPKDPNDARVARAADKRARKARKRLEDQARQQLGQGKYQVPE